MFEFERRGYLQAGPWVPEVVLEHPELVRQLHEEFVHAGSEVTEAFTYYGHREKLRLIGREHDLEPMNRKALEICRQVCDETGTYMAGNICNTTRYDPNNPTSHQECLDMFKESIQWAVEGGSDFIVAETFSDFGEGKLALEAIQQWGNGLPAVVMYATHSPSGLKDGVKYPDACKYLLEHGAAAAGLNCSSGPETIIDYMKDIRKACPDGVLACLPVPYRTTPKEPNMQSIIMPNGKRAFWGNLDAYMSSCDEIETFGKECQKLNIQYVGICCGNSARYFRTLAESYGRRPPASRFTKDMDKHYIFGNKEKNPLLHSVNVDTLKDSIGKSWEEKKTFEGKPALPS